MPAQYDAIKAKFLSMGKSMKEAKTSAAKIYESRRKPGQSHIQTVAAQERKR